MDAQRLSGLSNLMDAPLTPRRPEHGRRFQWTLSAPLPVRPN